MCIACKVLLILIAVVGTFMLGWLYGTTYHKG